MNKNNFVYLIVGVILGGVAVYLMLGTGLNLAENENIRVVAETHEDGHIDNHSEVINISDRVMKEFGIEVKKAGTGKLVVYRDLTGEIVPNPYKVAHIVPRFGGVVKAVYKKIGDKVKEGDKIAVIESNESLVQYDVISSIDGTILELHMTPGELIGDDKHIVMIANLNTVWAELNVYQQNLGEVKVGQTVEITSPHSKTVFKGELFYISPTVDEATRTAVARVKLDNSQGVWKPGMFVSGKVFTSLKTVEVAVPKNAVQLLDGQKVVFVKGDEGFHPQVVTLGMENGELVEILDGLHAGDIYVAKGAYTFKSEILKESFGGHGH